MKKFLKVIVTGLSAAGLIFLAVGCSSGQNSTQTSESDTTTVQRGDLTLEITSVGNLALSQTEDLAFEIAGTVEEVLVSEGDSVTEGQELVKLDTSEWDDLVKTRKSALVTAQRALDNSERQITAKELAVRQAELDLKTAEYNMIQIDEVKKAQDNVETAEFQLKLTKSIGPYQSESSDNYASRILNLEGILAKAQQDLQTLLSGNSMSVSTSVALQIEKYLLQVEKAGMSLEDARVALENARLDRDDDEQDVNDAQSNLDEVLALSPVIKAPFDGFITKVNVEGGDEVLKGTIAVQLADPDKFEAEILVSEMDIVQVTLGGNAWVEVDSLDGLSLPAIITHISPKATIQSGVVNYKVKVEITSFETLAQEQQESRQSMMGDMSSEAMEERMKQAVAEGRLTQEQADSFAERMQSGEMPFTPGSGFGQGQFAVDGEIGQGQLPSGAGTGQLPTVVPEDFQLREGLTVTISLIVSEASNVLLVPNAAITSRGQQSFVQVVSANSTEKEQVTEERAIKVGMTDYQFTEVTSGLSEGEKITVPKGTSTTTTTTTQQFRQGGFMIPGMGGR